MQTKDGDSDSSNLPGLKECHDWTRSASNAESQASDSDLISAISKSRKSCWGVIGEVNKRRRHLRALAYSAAIDTWPNCVIHHSGCILSRKGIDEELYDKMKDRWVSATMRNDAESLSFSAFGLFLDFNEEYDMAERQHIEALRIARSIELTPYLCLRYLININIRKDKNGITNEQKSAARDISSRANDAIARLGNPPSLAIKELTSKLL